jgi:hypothetical protein
MAELVPAFWQWIQILALWRKNEKKTLLGLEAGCS